MPDPTMIPDSSSGASGLVLRDCEARDLPEIASIYAHWVLNGLASFELVPPSVAEMATRRAALVDHGYPYLVAADAASGAVLGYAYAGVYRTRPAYRFSVEDSVYVAPQARGRRIGDLLMPALIERCSAAGFRQMVAVIGDSANAASIALHARHGFTHAGLLPAVGWKFGRWVDSVLMTRALGDGAAGPPQE